MDLEAELHSYGITPLMAGDVARDRTLGALVQLVAVLGGAQRGEVVTAHHLNNGLLRLVYVVEHTMIAMIDNVSDTRRVG